MRNQRRHLAFLGPALAVVGLLLSSVAATAGHAAWVVSPDMQPVLARLLQPQADAVQIAGVQLERDHVAISLAPPQTEGAAPVALRVYHPNSAPKSAQACPVQGDFAIVSVSSTPPPQLCQALAARLSTIAGDFRWTEVADLPAVATPTDGGITRKIEEIANQLSRHDEQGARTAVAGLLREVPVEQADAPTAWTVAVLLAQLHDDATAQRYVERTLQATDNLRPTEKTGDLRNLAIRAAALRVVRRDAEADQLLRDCRTVATDGAACHNRPAVDWAKAHGDWKLAAQWMDRDQGDGMNATLSDLVERAAVAMRLNDSPGELRWAQMARQRFPNELAALELWASANFRAQKFEEAIRTYEAVFKRDPNRPSVLAHLSGAFNRMHGTHRGSAYEADYLRLKAELDQRATHPEDIAARFLHAVGVFYDAQFEEAIPLFQQLEPQLPREPRIQIYLAMSNYWLGRVKEAQVFAKKAVERGPYDPDVYYVRSKVFQDEDRQGAARDLQRYIDMAEAPGAIAFSDKTARVREERAALLRGERPPDWDRPGFDNLDDGKTRWLSLGLAVLIGIAVLWRRRREAQA